MTGGTLRRPAALTGLKGQHKGDWMHHRETWLGSFIIIFPFLLNRIGHNMKASRVPTGICFQPVNSPVIIAVASPSPSSSSHPSSFSLTSNLSHPDSPPTTTSWLHPHLLKSRCASLTTSPSSTHPSLNSREIHRSNLTETADISGANQGTNTHTHTQRTRPK